jgi:CheY-like chemotaxis protein
MTPKTVLVAHPNPGTQQRIADAFKGAGFTLLRASDGAEATRLAAGTSIDLYFGAVRLPGGLSGLKLAREVRDRHPAALIYLLVGGFDVLQPGQAEDAGLDGVISMPFTPAGLRARVEDTIGPILPTPGHQAAQLTPLSADEPLPLPMDALAPVAPEPVHGALLSDERLASFLPREFRHAEPVGVDPAILSAALERSIMEVLPEVVEAILRNALVSSPTFREVVRGAVEKAVTDQLPSALRAAAQNIERGR